MEALDLTLLLCLLGQLRRQGRDLGPEQLLLDVLLPSPFLQAANKPPCRSAFDNAMSCRLPLLPGYVRLVNNGGQSPRY